MRLPGASLSFKHPEDEVELLELDIGCIYVLEQLRMFAACIGVPVLVITEILRASDPHSVHYFGRGIDVRLRPMTMEQAETFAEWINTRMSYGGRRNIVIVGKYDPSGRHNDHFHIQAPPPTVCHGFVPFQRMEDNTPWV